MVLEVEMLCVKIDSLNKDIERAKISESDSNVLSVAMNKIQVDRGKLLSTIKAYDKNKYIDMNDYFENKINKDYKRLKRNYKIVLNLYNVAIDKNRETLLQYLKD